MSSDENRYQFGDGYAVVGRAILELRERGEISADSVGLFNLLVSLANRLATREREYFLEAMDISEERSSRFSMKWIEMTCWTMFYSAAFAPLHDQRTLKKDPTLKERSREFRVRGPDSGMQHGI